MKGTGGVRIGQRGRWNCIEAHEAAANLEGLGCRAQEWLCLLRPPHSITRGRQLSCKHGLRPGNSAWAEDPEGADGGGSLLHRLGTQCRMLPWRRQHICMPITVHLLPCSGQCRPSRISVDPSSLHERKLTGEATSGSHGHRLTPRLLYCKIGPPFLMPCRMFS